MSSNGAVFRVVKDKNYTCINNQIFQETNMSWGAKGLFCQMLSLPENWNFSVSGLCALSKESIYTVKRLLRELSDFGYLQVIKHKPDETNNGRYSYEYIIYESPIKTRWQI